MSSQGNMFDNVPSSGASSLEKRSLSRNGSFWYHFSAKKHIFS